MSPIRPENRRRYPPDWPAISAAIRLRSDGRCECDGRCHGRSHAAPAAMRCAARHLAPHPITGSTVVLTVAHLDHTPENCTDDNLRAMCQGCHLAYDADHHAATARATRAAALAAQMDPLFEVQP